MTELGVRSPLIPAGSRKAVSAHSPLCPPKSQFEVRHGRPGPRYSPGEPLPTFCERQKQRYQGSRGVCKKIPEFSVITPKIRNINEKNNIFCKLTLNHKTGFMMKITL